MNTSSELPGEHVDPELLAERLLEAFNWSESPEGFDYWERKFLMLMEQVPKNSPTFKPE